MKKKTILALITAFVMGALAVTPLFAQDTKTANEKLLEAVYQANERDIDKAIAEGADVLMTDRYRNNLLHLLLKDPIAETFCGDTDRPLLKIYDSKKSAVAEKLIHLGVDVNAKNSAGFTPLMYAAMNNYSKVVKTLTNEKNKADVNATANNGFTALIYTIADRSYYFLQSRYIDIINTLIEKGADVNANGNTALWFAVYHSDLSTVKILLDAGAKKNKGIYYDAKHIYNKYKKEYDELIDKKSKGKIVTDSDIRLRTKDMKITKEIMELVKPEEVKVEEQKKFQEEMMKAFEENVLYKPAWELPQ